MGDTSSHDRDWLLNQKPESRISIYRLVLRIEQGKLNLWTYQSTQTGLMQVHVCRPRRAIPIGRYGSIGTVVHTYSLPLHAIAQFRNKRRFFCGDLGATVLATGWYYHTRHLGEVETRTFSEGQRAAALHLLVSRTELHGGGASIWWLIWYEDSPKPKEILPVLSLRPVGFGDSCVSSWMYSIVHTCSYIYMYTWKFALTNYSV